LITDEAKQEKTCTSAAGIDSATLPNAELWSTGQRTSMNAKTIYNTQHSKHC